MSTTASPKEIERLISRLAALEGLGPRLAGSVAHHLNNLLTPIIGFTDLALSTLQPGAPVEGMLQEVLKAAQRGADLAQQLLAYSGKGRFVLQAVRLPALVAELVPLLRRAIAPGARLVYVAGEDEGSCVEADPGQLRQVVTNLVLNASEALEGAPGEITLRTGIERVESPLPAPPSGPGVYAWLEVADTGVGMDEATLASIFEPFFSTKFTGRGLGLSAVGGIVRGHGGFLHASSPGRGRGSTFRVYFPCPPGSPSNRDQSG